MSRSIGLAHIVRQDDGAATGVWGGYALKSAFQPIFAFEHGKLVLVACEGLLRPFRDGEPVSLPSFFAAVPPLDRIHVETLARTLHILNGGKFLGKELGLFINIDPSLLTEAAAVQLTLREMRLALHEAEVYPGRLVCEVTEQQTKSAEALSSLAAALRRQGLRIAVDDYGAEESDSARIDVLRPDIVKFDAHWISRLMASRDGYAMLGAMVAGFKDRRIFTVFEGIEESWQLRLADKCGASMVQGYGLAKPKLAPARFSVFATPEPRGPAARRPAAPAQQSAGLLRESANPGLGRIPGGGGR